MRSPIFLAICTPRFREDSKPDRGKKVISGWKSDYTDKKTILQLLIPAEECESVIDKFEQRFAETSGYNIVLLPVEAFLPRPKPENSEIEAEEKEQPKEKRHRVSREELYSDINEGIKIKRSFMAMTILAAFLCTSNHTLYHFNGPALSSGDPAGDSVPLDARLYRWIYRRMD